MTAVRSADRTLLLFERFESVGRPMMLSELAEEMRIPLSSCHGLVQTLFERGYLYSMGARKEFYPTSRLFDVAQAIAEKDPVLDRISPVINALRDRERETVLVGKRQGDAVLYLAVAEGLHTIRYHARVGEYKPLHSSSIGKALLGSMPMDALRRWLQSANLESITPRTITDGARLLRELESGRERGYHVTRGENVVDVTAVAAPVRLNGEVFGIAVAGPSHRLRSREAEIGASLLEAAASLDRPVP